MSTVFPIDIAPLPLAGERREILNRALEGLTPTQLAWVSGYIAALADARAAGSPAGAAPAYPVVTGGTSPATAPKAEPGIRPTVLYASQTGTGKRIAEQLAASLSQAGIEPRLCRASDFNVREIGRERLLYVVISTHGDGDPPDDARAFLDFLKSKRAPKLPQLEYAVLALGDSSYPQYCATGRTLDARLAELGAQAVFPRVDSDVDVERYAEPWLRDALAHGREFAARSGVATVTALRGPPPAAVQAASAARHDRNHPYAAQVLVNQRISGRGAAKAVHHLELALEGEGLAYEPGDALAVVPRNPPSSVEALLAATRLDGDARVERDGTTLTLAEWLATRAEITRIARPVLAALAERNPDPRLARLLGAEGREELRERLATEQVADVLAEFPVDWTPDALVAALRPLAHRAYSIASSRQLVGNEVHVTVALVGGENATTPRWGAASSFLAGLGDDARVPVFIERNERFRLPSDPSADVIMIGAGTGVAPYRGFLQEREATGARGRNWLIFGGRNFLRDFLYQSEWLEARRRGLLQRVDLAFSRDQRAKVYVQQRLREQGREIYAWLEGGASLYVCGDANRMAPDVHAALIDVVAKQAQVDADGARARVEQWMADGRYLRDVY